MEKTQYAPVGSRVIFENDRVRVWEVELAAGETLPMHLHEADYLVVSLTGGSTTVEWEDGRRENHASASGDVVWRESPHAHALTNDGPGVYRNRLIEFKR